jgi:Mg-chelatase subunit ChlD
MNTEILAVLDISGSMAPIAADAIGGFNTFLKDQQSVEGEARLTVALFDDQYELLYTAKPLADAEPLTSATFVPRGATALMDAIGRTLSVQGARIEAEGWAEKVIVCITTDGGENQSREFNAPMVRELVTQAEAKGWVFVFLAANQDAFATATHYGMSGAHAQNFAANGAGVGQAYASISNVTRSLRTGESVMPPQAEASLQAALVAKATPKPRKARKGA